MDSLILANTILYRFNKQSMSIRPMKLQKILYFCVGFCSKLAGDFIIDEPFYKLDYGPVCIKVYNFFKTKNGNIVKKYAVNKDNSVLVYELDQDKDKVLDDVIFHYGGYSDFQLSNMTHKKGSPWDTADWYFPIENKNIIDYFSVVDIGRY